VLQLAGVQALVVPAQHGMEPWCKSELFEDVRDAGLKWWARPDRCSSTRLACKGMRLSMPASSECSALQVYCPAPGGAPGAAHLPRAWGMLACLSIICVAALLVGACARAWAPAARAALALLLRAALRRCCNAWTPAGELSVRRTYEGAGPARGAPPAARAPSGAQPPSLASLVRPRACALRPTRPQPWAVGAVHVTRPARRPRSACRRAAGVRASNVHLGGRLRARLAPAHLLLAEASAAELELELPGWRRPLRVRLQGVRLELQQRRLPQARRRPGCCRGAAQGPALSRPAAPRLLRPALP
jgi:hypothetical protein